MNLNKCAFGVSAGEFLGFLVHEGGIEVGKKSMKVIDEVVPPTNLKELQSLLGKINFVRRFISNLSQKVLPFSPLLRIKKDQKFVWGYEQQKAFDEIKRYMTSVGASTIEQAFQVVRGGRYPNHWIDPYTRI
jgi:hypothetical protein